MDYSVLVVEDDRSVAELLRITLEDEGFEVQLVDCGQAAIDAIERGLAPDAMVLDWMLPDVDGMYVLSRLRAHPVVGETPVMMLTAKQGDADEAQSLRTGADVYVRKPFDPMILAVSLEMLIATDYDQRRLERLGRLADLGATT